jgi:hypothetical protein
MNFVAQPSPAAGSGGVPPPEVPTGATPNATLHPRIEKGTFSMQEMPNKTLDVNTRMSCNLCAAV